MEKLKNKWLLLDTNILIDSAKYLDSFKSFFELLSSYNIIAAIDEVIKLEYLRSANTNDALGKKVKFLNYLLGDESKRGDLKIDNNLLIDARRISNLVYAYGKNKDMDFADCIIAAQLKRHKSNLFLATNNNKHFTTILFDRKTIHNIEIEDEIITVGIYQFSEKKYSDLVDRFSKTK